MQPQELIVKDWKVWATDGTPMQDSFGNYKGSVVFEEYSSEPVDATFKTEPKIGDKKYGKIVDYKTKTGKLRTKFQREDRPPEETKSSDSSASSSSWQPRDDKAIQAQWAIGQAASWVTINSGEFDQIEEVANKFFAMIDRVKISNDPVVTETVSTPPIVYDEPLPDMPPDFLDWSQDQGYEEERKQEYKPSRPSYRDPFHG